MVRGIFVALLLTACGGATAPTPDEALDRYVRADCACRHEAYPCHEQVRQQVSPFRPECLEQWAAVYERTCTGTPMPGEVSADCGGPQ